MTPSLASSTTVALGGALVHALWQCAAIAACAWAGLRVLRNQGAQARYLMSCAALGLMLVLPAATFFWLWEPPIVALTNGTGGDQAVVIVHATATSQGASWRPWLPWLITAWTAGVCVMSLRLAGGWFWLQRLRWVQAGPAEPCWQERVGHLAHRLGLHRPPRLLTSGAVEVPMVLGWLRPVILMPAAVFVAMDPRALEAILAHELAHIRRHDYFINLLQSAVEVLLFFHPAVWWLSAQVRLERENCCDDIAISLCGDPRFYARALTDLEELRPSLAPNPSLALAATGGTLMHRIRRILTPTLPPSPAARVGLLAALAVSVLGAASSFGLHPQDPIPKTEPQNEVHDIKKVVSVQVDDRAQVPRKLKIEMKGKMKIQPEAKPPEALEEGARLLIEGKDGDQTRSYVAERKAGNDTRIWMLDGKAQAPDAQAEAWLKRGLEAAQKFTLRWEDGPQHGSDMAFRWKKLKGGGEQELQAKAKVLEEKAKALAEKRAIKGVSEKEVAQLQEDVSRQAREVADQARKLAAAHVQVNDDIQMIVAESRADADHAKQVGEEVRKDVKKRITVKRLKKDGDPTTIFVEEGNPDTISLDMQVGGDSKHVTVKRQGVHGPSGEILILRGHDEDPKAEIEALKKAIEQMQGRLDKLQQEAAKAPAK